MKKLLIAAMAASIVMAFTGCGSDDEGSSNADTTTTTTTTTTSAEDTDDTKTSESDDNEEPETDESISDPVEIADPVESESGDDSTSDSDISDFTSGKFFSFEADETNWATTEDAFGNTTVTYIGTDIPEATQTCFLIINSEEDEDLPNYSFDELAPLFVTSMGLGDDFVVEEENSTEFNGYDAYIIDGTYTQASNEFDIEIILCRQDTKLVVIAAMAYSEAAEVIQPEFQTILDTVKIV